MNHQQKQKPRLVADSSQSVWRYVNLLLVAQALGAAATPILVSLGGLVGEDLAGNKSLATLPVSLYNIALALSTLPVALLIKRLGRANAYLLGALLAVFGGVLTTWGISSSSFLLFCAGAAIAGFYGACVQSYRFASVEYVTPREQPLAISRVMIGGLLAAVIGPQMAIWFRNLLPQPMAGSFLSQALLALLAFFLWLHIRRLLPVLQAAQVRETGLGEEVSQPAAENTGRSLRQMIRNGPFLAALFAGMVSYGLMTFMMTATPLAMKHAGHSEQMGVLGVQWHVLAMYAPSFFTGRLMAEYGKKNITMTGLLLIALSGLAGMAGQSVFFFWTALILLGLGWNFGFLGATALVVAACRPNERTRVQAFNDGLVFGTTATASLASGFLLHHLGWFQLNLFVLPLIAFAVVLLLVVRQPDI